jgi:mRNA-degrading endonuclease RelE of RelBE toxin-antitoxin system
MPVCVANMMYTIDFTDSAQEDLRQLRKFDQVTIAQTVEVQLTSEPMKETRHRKSLEPNELAQRELRIGRFRVFYDVQPDERLVTVVAIGWKNTTNLSFAGRSRFCEDD